MRSNFLVLVHLRGKKWRYRILRGLKVLVSRLAWFLPQDQSCWRLQTCSCWFLFSESWLNSMLSSSSSTHLHIRLQKCHQPSYQNQIHPRLSSWCKTGCSIASTSRPSKISELVEATTRLHQRLSFLILLNLSSHRQNQVWGWSRYQTCNICTCHIRCIRTHQVFHSLYACNNGTTERFRRSCCNFRVAL